MNNNDAVIAGIFTVASAVLTLIVKGWLDRRKTQAETEATSIGSAMKLIETYRQDRDDLRRQIAALQVESETQRQEIWKLRQENAQLRSDLAATKREVADLQVELSEMKGTGAA